MKSDPRGRPHVGIVGAGFSGTILAVHLLRHGLRVTLIDRRGRFAEGLAYSTREPAHLLNVRAANMSAFADEPDHFAHWVGARGLGDGASFAPRAVYREYLHEILDGASGELSFGSEEAVGVETGGLRLASGSLLETDAIVIAAGNLPSAPFRNGATLSPLYVNDPWSGDGRRGLDELARSRGDILILGTGLTMVDTVLSLDSRGFEGRVIALSRRGLLPRPHAATVSAAIEPPTSHRLCELIRWTRLQARAAPWRAVVDSLRPVTASIWMGWSREERTRFLRHLRPWWDVHRHRIAPQVQKRLQSLVDDGRLTVRAGRVVGGKGGTVVIRARGAKQDEALRFVGIVNCTGPQGDLRKSRDPLICSFLESGIARVDVHGLGFDINERGGLVGADGKVSDRFYAVGPMTRGALWEIVAVPDIREQVRGLAATIAGDLGQMAETSAWQGVRRV